MTFEVVLNQRYSAYARLIIGHEAAAAGNMDVVFLMSCDSSDVKQLGVCKAFCDDSSLLL